MPATSVMNWSSALLEPERRISSVKIVTSEFHSAFAALRAAPKALLSQHGSPSCGFSQLSTLARMRADDVLPVPRGPENRYAWPSRWLATAVWSARTIALSGKVGKPTVDVGTSDWLVLDGAELDPGSELRVKGHALRSLSAASVKGLAGLRVDVPFDHRLFVTNAPDLVRLEVHDSYGLASAGRDVAYTVCNDADTLAWLGNQAALEFHPAPVRRHRLERPDLLVVDIDPPGDAFEAAVEAALLVLETLGDLGLEPLVKTTGGKGLHIVVPIVRHASAERFRRAATRLAEIAIERRPDLVTAEFRKAKRAGRVMLDPSRNGPGATVVAPYSPRARAQGTVSFPVLPKDLKAIAPADFTLATVPGLLRRPAVKRWSEAAAAPGQRLPAALLRD